MGNMLLGVANSSYVTLSNIAGYGYTFTENLDKVDIRTKGGTLFSYITPASTYQSFKIPMSLVTSSDRAQINSWFTTATNLRFIEDDDFPNSYYNVRITGRTDPFNKFPVPYFRQYYDGEIVIETT
jgi:hypothetical protein